MPVCEDLTGRRFGRLMVVRRAANNKNGDPAWHCVCDCGTEKVVSGSASRQGHTRSCSCLRRELNSTLRPPVHEKHGQAGAGAATKEYRAWQSMKARCYTESTRAFHRYGGRGIRVCDRWRDDFVAFFADLGPCPPGRSLDRVDNDGDYEPGNVRWASCAVQARNRSNNHFIEYAGEKLTLTDWARRLGVSDSTLWYRLKQGIPLVEALRPRVIALAA